MSTAFGPQPIDLAAPAGGAAVMMRLRELVGRRRSWQVLTSLVAGLAGLLVLALATGLLDHAFTFSRAVRIVFLALLLAWVLAAAASVGWSWLKRRSLTMEAERIQRLGGQTENSLVTYLNVTEERPAVPYYLHRKLESQAWRSLASIDPRRIADRKPARWFGFVAVGAAAVIVIFAAIAPAMVAREVERLILLRSGPVVAPEPGGGSLALVNPSPGTPAIRQLNIRVVPPSYSGLPMAEVQGDAPIRALAGSRVELVLETTGPVDGASFTFGGTNLPLRPAGRGDFAGTLVADKSGVLEVQLSGPNTVPVVHPLEVYADAVPEIRLTEPAADQLWKTLPSRPVSLRWAATDDLALSEVTLKYIKSRGAGDAATFVNGELPGRGAQQPSPKEWSGGAVLDLRKLQMEPGDTLVVWAEARDRRPDRETVGRSSSIALALSAPELAKINLDGLGPTELGKFLLSERMILQHTERLHRERPRMVARDISRRANDIAGEQRDFRNSLGGFTTNEGMAGSGQLELNATGGPPSPGSVDQQVQELVSERNEIHRHGIPDPPQGAPQKVRDLILAMQAMGDAEEALAVPDTVRAMEFMRTALTRLKSAQAAERYIPPINATSRPIDLKRRYSGELADIKTRLESLARRSDVAGAGDLRIALTEAYAALGELSGADPQGRGRAREHIRLAAERLSLVTGEHAVAVGTALAQLRIVERALTGPGATGADPETPFRLLLQATANLFNLVEARVPSSTGFGPTALPTSGVRSADYFRRLGSRP